MGKTYIKTIIREVKGSFGRFFAIFSIVALGVGFLAGLLAATPSMEQSVDTYYKENNMADIIIKASFGLDDEDLKEVVNIKDIDEIMPVYVLDEILESDSKDLYTSRIYGLPFNRMGTDQKNIINQLDLKEGRLPRADNECLVEESGTYLEEIKLGSVLNVVEGSESSTHNIYKNTEYVVVGIVSNPFYFSMERERTSIGDGTISSIIYINEDNYSLDRYTDFYIKVRNPNNLASFTEEYEDYIEDVVSDIDDIKKDDWYVLDRQSNVSYMSFASNVTKVDAIAKVFPVFFLLVAGLVALTTMTRMVEEDRIQIGTLKALGYTNIVIVSKYVIYSGLASLLGSILGLFGGLKILPNVIWGAYENMYTLPQLTIYYDWAFLIILACLAIASTIFATILASSRILREKPAALMVPRAPKPGKRIFLEKINFIWSRLKFTYKATARNLLRYKKHFFMTVIGISGCTSLIVAGFGLKDSIGDIANIQFNEIFEYNLIIDKIDSDKEDKILEEFLNDPSKVIDYIQVFSGDGKLISGGSSYDVSIISPKDTDKLKNFINLRNRKNGGSIDFNDTSLVIAEKLAEELDVSIGDSITIENSDNETKEFTVTGITENYVGSYIYINNKSYTEEFNNIEYNTLLLKTPISSLSEQDRVLEDILASETVLSAEFISQTKESYDNLLESINYIVIVLILAAGGLAVIVLYNLTNINIEERRKELATLKVLGFDNFEVASYMYRETTILSIIGTLVGLILGRFLHIFIVLEGESVDLMFGRDIKLTSFIISAVVTLIFTFIVDVAMYKKIKNIEMVDSMKAVD